MSSGFSLFPHFQITFPSVVLYFKLFSQNIPNISTLKNLEVPTCYSEGFDREFWSNLTYFQSNLFRDNFKKLFECNKWVIIFSCKSNNNLQSYSKYDIVFNCNFRYSLDYIKYFMPSILNMAQYFP